ncbi:proline--tRNA ligase [Paludibacterium purpuratum]|uniref:Proline--tRNA ligase n=1 Tax=Paludibacterium purpuratum TaxID=1144873 RepID=A0A4R7B740_9NEIS|nr:proline--tRNA ligase [Paludibacterium purpuratum]TDR80564.1 prolyl-tRNA synthetase [Paludibacterium purpuratum]
MRAAQFFISTLKEAPAEAELPSHKLMLRAGLIKRLASGLYSWMPMGLRVLRKVEAVVREEMNRAGSVELLMPSVQPAELWQESGRWEFYGKELLRMKDRHDRDFCYGPTHEEVVTDIVRKEINSYKQLPKNFFQVQTKFRDEVRPRFGVMRAREFVMKDAYSFHTDFDSLVETYNGMYQAYCNVFNRLGLKFRAVAADTGSIGGTGSHEFQVLADSGEDLIAYCPDSDYAANIELAEALAPAAPRAAATAAMQTVVTPNVKTIAQLVDFLKVDIRQTVKAVVVESDTDEPVLMMVRGDHELNEVKAEKIAGIKKPLTMATPAAIRDAFGAQPGSLGPVGFKGRVIADRTVAAMADMVVGANRDDEHLTGVNFGRDCAEAEVADIRNVVAGDPSPCGKGTLALCRGIEVGHVFQLRTKYAEPLSCNYLDRDGKLKPMEMGCYGIGVSRIVGAAIEQGHDERGIVFTDAMAPFTVVIVPMGYGRSELVRAAADKLHDELAALGIDVLLDDRDERPGVLLADSELLGIPHRVVIGERGLADGKVEYQGRRDASATAIDVAQIAAHLRASIAC